MNQFAGGMKEATDYERKLAADSLADKNRPSASDFIKTTIKDADGHDVDVLYDTVNRKYITPEQYSATMNQTTDLSVVPDSFSGRTKATQNIGITKNDDNSISIDLAE